jgi:hypothetical protein
MHMLETQAGPAAAYRVWPQFGRQKGKNRKIRTGNISLGSSCILENWFESSV